MISVSVEVFEALQPDVVGTQEANLEQLNDLASRLPDYEFTGEGNLGPLRSHSDQNWYSAIFYRRDRVRPVDGSGEAPGIGAIGGRVGRVEPGHALAQRLGHRLDGDASVSGQVEIVHVHARMGLVTGHGCGAVVQDDQGEVVVVEHRVDQTGYSGTKERGISDKRDDFFVCCL